MIDRSPAVAPGAVAPVIVSGPAGSGRAGRGTLPRWGAPLLLAFVALLVYLANGRPNGAIDTLSNELVPVVLWTKGSLDIGEFDRFDSGGVPGGSGFAHVVGGVTLPKYPIATGLLVAPFYLPSVRQRARTAPTTLEWIEYAQRSGKTAAAIVTALSVAVFVLLARRLGANDGLAIALGFAYAFGSSAWSISSQALWQHGPGVLMLLLAALASLAHDARPRAATAAVVGVCCGLAVAIRVTNVLFAAPLLVWLLIRRRGHLVSLFLPFAAFVSLLVGYNLVVWGHPAGFYGTITTQPQGHLLGRLAGVLASPGRGLLVYFPLALLGLGGLAVATRSRQLLASLWGCLAAFVGLQLLAIGQFFMWWGGASFGPRLTTEIQPALLLLSIPLFAAAGARRAWLVAAFGVLLVWSIPVQAVGAFLYSGSWDAWPAFIDVSPQRLWDWRDNPVHRDLTLDRLRWVVFKPAALTDFRAEYRAPARLGALAGAEVILPVHVSNRGTERWLPYGSGIGGLAVHLSYHLAPAGSSRERREGPRTHLGEIVSPGEEVVVGLRVVAPMEPGRYLLEVSLVQELVDWFESRGTPPAPVELWVSRRQSASAPAQGPSGG